MGRKIIDRVAEWLRNETVPTSSSWVLVSWYYAQGHRRLMIPYTYPSRGGSNATRGRRIYKPRNLQKLATLAKLGVEVSMSTTSVEPTVGVLHVPVKKETLTVREFPVYGPIFHYCCPSCSWCIGCTCSMLLVTDTVSSYARDAPR